MADESAEIERLHALNESMAKQLAFAVQRMTDMRRRLDERETKVEIRTIQGAIDEICIDGCSVHIEQMSDDGWFMGVSGSNGDYWQFWFGAKNRRSHVEFRHTEFTPYAPIISQDQGSPER